MKLFALLTAFAIAFAPQALAQEAKKPAKDAKKSELNREDRGFLRDMLRADLAEVRAGKLAATRAVSTQAQEFAQHMVGEHGNRAEAARKLAKQKRVEAPSQPDKKHQAALKKLEGLKGPAFDKAYMQQMVRDHEDTLKLVQKAAKEAKDKDLKAAAEKSIPVVQQHLERAKLIEGLLP
jgi:putative membrane protein